MDSRRANGADQDLEAPDAARTAGLAYVSDEEPGIRRRQRGKGFSYIGPSRAKLAAKPALKRIRSLAVPPAWSDVWICPEPNGHIQATGRDARGRKQYIYHPGWREVRDSTKFEHMLEFARLLPRIRKRVEKDMRRRRLVREKVLATVVHLLETTLIRVGNLDYAEQNKSYGLTTLRDRHAEIDGSELRFEFKGKSGATWKLRMKDRRIARLVKQCQDIPGQHLFQYFDENGDRQPVTSTEVNAYLREISGADVTAKDFRTWAGTVLAAAALVELEDFETDARAKHNVNAAVKKVAARLGNTPAICRKCYVHPDLLECYLEGRLSDGLGLSKRAVLGEDLPAIEAAVLRLLRRRLQERAKARRRGRAPRRLTLSQALRESATA